MSSNNAARRSGPAGRAGSFVRRLIGALILSCFAAPLHAQLRIREDRWNRGYDALAAAFRAAGLETVDRQQWQATPPDQSLLVALGDFRSYPVGLENYVRQGGAVVVASDRGPQGGARLRGISLKPGPVFALNQKSWFQGYADCPLVSSFAEVHPLTQGVLSIATNRPGAIYAPGGIAGAEWDTLAWLPELADNTLSDAGFLAAAETASGGRAVVIADQSVFANQMLGYEDNATFMINVVRWLAEGRTTVLMLQDHAIISPPDLDEVEVDFPPPRPEEVRDALQQLPPDVLVPFLNAVLASLEDAGIPDDLLTFLVEQIPRLRYRQLLLFVATFCLGLVALRRMIPEPVAEKAAADGDSPVRIDRRRRARLERQQAARELLERFRADLAETSAIPWPVFASRLRMKDNRWRTWFLRRRLRKASRRLAVTRCRYWSRRRLRRLNEHINAWRLLRTAGNLEYKT